MKRALSILALGIAAVLARGTDVNFHLQDSFGRSIPNARVILTPVPNLSLSTNGAGQITGDFILFRTDTNANATVTNVAAPATYRQVTFGPSTITTNYLQIPSSTNAVNAKDWVVPYPTGLGHILYEEAGVVGGRILTEP